MFLNADVRERTRVGASEGDLVRKETSILLVGRRAPQTLKRVRDSSVKQSSHPNTTDGLI